MYGSVWSLVRLRKGRAILILGEFRVKITFSFVVLLLLVLSVDSLVAAEGVRIGYFNKEPVIFQAETNIPTGIAVDVFNDIASENQWSCCPAR